MHNSVLISVKSPETESVSRERRDVFFIIYKFYLLYCYLLYEPFTFVFR